jgi:hypothetical protein
MKNKNKNKQIETRGVGRPAKAINYPNRKFTMPDLVELNKDICTKLCLIQHLQKDALLGKKSVIVKTDEKRPNASGRGRKLEVYQKRSRMTAGAVAPVATKRKVKAKAITVTVATVAPVEPVAVPVVTTEQYEAQKAALLAPEPAAVETAPVVATTMETPVAA